MDGACVNQGKRNVVTRKTAEAIPHNVINIWYVAHKLELAMLNVIKVSSSVVGLVEECVNFVYRCNYRSSKRRRDLKQIGDIIDEDVVYFSAPKGTRWMASRQRAYSALRQDLAVVCAHVEEASTGKGEEVAKCKGYLRQLRSLNFKQALHFMIDVLNILAGVSCAFQKDDLLITDIAVKVGAGCLKRKAFRQLNGKVFVEYTASEETSPSEMQRADLCDFVDKVVAFVETRFQFLKQTPFSNFQVFDYCDHPNTNEEEFACYGNADIVALCQHFEGIIGRDTNDTIGLSLKMLLSRKRRRCLFETYTKV